MIPTLYAIFFLSGVAALIFETLWFHQASLAFGNSVWASSLVLSSFMLGLAFGNALAARFADRIGRPLRSYAMLEVAIAVGGLALVWGLPSLAPLLGRVFEPVADQPWLLNFLRLGSAFALMLIPATAMGATLPVLLKALVDEGTSFGGGLGRLYGCNALGAVVGAVAGELFFVEWLGVRGTGFAAAACNALAALGGLEISRRIARRSRPAINQSDRPRRGIDGQAIALLGAALLSGFILLALEVVWFRFLQLFVVGTSVTFSFMLATVLAGIGTGGLLAGLILGRLPTAYTRSGLLALLAGAICSVVYAGFALVVTPQASVIVQDASTVAWLTFALSFPVSTLSGALFTFLGAALAEHIEGEARTAGWLTFANTVGAGIGSLTAGFVLLPWLGMEASLWGLGAGYGAVAALAVVGTAPAWRSQRLGLGVAVALFAGATLLFPHGLVQSRYLPLAVQRVASSGTWQIVDVREGQTETAVYLRKVFSGETLFHLLMTNGYSMSGTRWHSRRYMKLYVYWPVAVAGAPKSALLISYGVGSTAKALTDTASLERIDIVDISRDILELSEIVYPDPSLNPLRDPRVHVHVEDGRQFLQQTRQRYDLITGEPPPPKTAGVVNLYTAEYFQLIYERLNPGGVNSYWLPVHSLAETDARAIIRAYCQVFTDCSLWAGTGLDWMLIGSREGRWHRDEATFAAQWQDPVVGPELRSLGFELPEQLGALFMSDAEGLAELSSGTLPLTDDFPKRLTSELPETLGTVAVFAPWMDTERARERFANSSDIEAMWPTALRERSLDYFHAQRLINAHSTAETLSAGERIILLDRLLTTSRLESPVLLTLGTTLDEVRLVESQRERGVEIDPLLANTILAARALAERRYSDAADLIGAAQRRSPRSAALLYYRLYTLCMAERADEAAEAARRAQSWLPTGDALLWSFLEQRCGVSDPR